MTVHCVQDFSLFVHHVPHSQQSPQIIWWIHKRPNDNLVTTWCSVPNSDFYNKLMNQKEKEKDYSAYRILKYMFITSEHKTVGDKATLH